MSEHERILVCVSASPTNADVIRRAAALCDALGAEMGSYTHRANSFHCYERDFSMLDGYCARIRAGEVDCERDDLTFSYADDWAEQMADAREEIAAKVEALKMGHSER